MKKSLKHVKSKRKVNNNWELFEKPTRHKKFIIKMVIERDNETPRVRKKKKFVTTHISHSKVVYNPRVYNNWVEDMNKINRKRKRNEKKKLKEIGIYKLVKVIRHEDFLGKSKSRWKEFKIDKGIV